MGAVPSSLGNVRHKRACEQEKSPSIPGPDPANGFFVGSQQTPLGKVLRNNIRTTKMTSS